VRKGIHYFEGFLLGVSAWLCIQPLGAEAQGEGLRDDLKRAIVESKISGHLRSYNYSRIHDEGTDVNNNALAAGGDLRVDTGSLAGFNVGLGFYTANNIPTGLRVNEALVGTDHYLYALAEAFLEYKREHLMIRGGRQLIDTPWANEDMFTMLPRAFSGISATIEPLPWLNLIQKGDEDHDLKGRGAHRINPAGAEHLNPPRADERHEPHLSIFAARMFLYESRFEDNFTYGNRYTDHHTDGFATVGFRYHQTLHAGQIHAQGWYYQFYDFAQLGYVESRYKWRTQTSVAPFAAAQVAIERNSGEERLGPVDCQIYGALVGIAFPRGHVTLVGNYSPENFNSFRHGGLVHPYNDLSGTLYTDTMNNGISDLGPSYAYGVKGDYSFFGEDLAVSAAFVRYRVKYGFGGAAYPTDGAFGFPKGAAVKDQAQWAVDAGIVYSFSGFLKGLTIENHVGIRDFENSPYGAFIDNRFACIYAFSF
jgi:hypothetical protein